jgi:small GTP-binding protein
MVDIAAGEDGGQIKKILKVLVVGEMGTGKTSLIRQYVQGFFSGLYKTTIGVDFANKDFDWDEHTSISLQLWDIAGQERYGNMTHVYYQEAVAAFVVFDLTRVTSLDMVIEWKKDIDTKVFTSEDKPIPCILLGNKIDLCQDGKWAKSEEEMQEFIRANQFVGFFPTSAADGTNIDDAARALVKYVLDNRIEPHGANDDAGVDLKAASNRDPAPKGDCPC